MGYRDTIKDLMVYACSEILQSITVVWKYTPQSTTYFDSKVLS